MLLFASVMSCAQYKYYVSVLPGNFRGAVDGSNRDDLTEKA